MSRSLDTEKERFHPYDEWKMHIYSPARTEYSACLYYRIEVPFRGFKDAGLAEVFMDKGKHHHDRATRDSQSLASMLSSDINLFYALSGGEGERIVETVKAMKSGLAPDGVHTIYPPSIVYDIDDNLDYVHPFNPTFACFGIRDGKGRLLQPGEKIEVPLDSGETVTLWDDGVTTGEKGWTFDIERNKKYIAHVHRFARMADGWTCPSPYLMKYHMSENGYPQGYVYPNSVVPGDYPILRPFAPRKKNIRILWQGGASHMSDFYHLKPAFAYLAKKYPHVTFVFFGENFKYVTDVIPAKQLELHPWRNYEAYKVYRMTLDVDINLCVVNDDEFAKSKSCIKWYEGSLGTVPECTVATNSNPYNEEIVDGETGLLYEPNNSESFAANVEEAIKNVELRKRLAENAKKWVLDNRHYLKTIHGLYDYYTELRARKAAELGEQKGTIVVPEKPKKARPKKKSKRAKRGR